MSKVGSKWRERAQVYLGVVFALPAVFALTPVERPLSIRSNASQTAKQGAAGDGVISAEPIESADDVCGLPAANSRLKEKVRRVLDSYYLQPLNTRDDAPWSVLHWSIAYGTDATICVGEPSGPRVSAIDWLCSNNPSAGEQLMLPRGNGMTQPIAPGLQGHDGQFLSMLAQSKVNRDHPLLVGDRKLTVADLVEHEKQSCRAGMELTFELIGLAYYEGSDAMWNNDRGESWSVRRLLEEELKQPVSRNSTCGGLHRLFAINYAVERRGSEGKPIAGPWRVAQQRTTAYQQRAFQLQNPDGSFSTAWLDLAEHRDDVTRRLTTSGHILEWLAYSLPVEQLRDPRFEQAVDYVADLLDGKQKKNWHRGALGHALHALAIYDQRTRCTQPGERGERLQAM